MQCVSYAFGTYGVDKMSLELCSVEAWSCINPNTRSAQCILCHLLLLGTAAPLLLTLDTALAACFDSWSLNQPSYSFGMPFPPSMRGMNAVAGQAISRRAQIKRTIIVLKMPTAARKGLERFWVERVITFLKRDERKIARFFLPRNRATRHLDPSRPHANDMLRSPSGRYNNKVEK